MQTHDEREDARLRALLREDLGDDADALLATVRRLRRWQAPDSTPRPALLALLRAQLPTRVTAGERLRRAFQRALDSLLLLRAQFRVVHRLLWLASAFVMALGVTSALLFSVPGMLTPLTLVAPLVAAVGIAFIYGPDADPPMELLLTTPISPRAVLLARLALVFGFNLLLGIAASAAVALLSGGQYSVWALVVDWLAPMAFLSALALLTGALTFDPNAGISVSLVLWFVLCIGRFDAAGSLNLPVALPDFATPTGTAALWTLAAGLAAAALWVVGREGHWAQEKTL